MANGASKNVLTTGEVARICNVAPRTVSKWFDSGQLRGYRIPGSKDRRIPVDQLLRFMKAHGMPTERLELGAASVLLVDEDEELLNILCDALRSAGDYRVLAATSAFQAGVLLEQHRPRVVVIDLGLIHNDHRSVFQTLRSYSHLSPIRLIGTTGGMTEGQGQALLQQGFAGYLRKPFDIRQLRDLLEQVLDQA